MDDTQYLLRPVGSVCSSTARSRDGKASDARLER